MQALGRRSNARPSILFATEVVPEKLSLNGFSPRVHHFLKALARDANVHLVLICIGERTANVGRVKELSLSSIEILHVPARPAAVGFSRKALRAVRYVVPSDPSGVYPMQLSAFDDLVSRLRPQAVATHMPILSGLGLGLSRDVKLISVLEEASERLLQTSLQSKTAIHRRLAISAETRRMRSFYPRVGARSDLNVLISDEEREYFGTALPDHRTVVVPHAIDCDLFNPTLIRGEAEDFDIAVFGDLAQPRNWLGILQVMEEAAKSHTSGRRWRWLLVGNVTDDVRRTLLAFPDVTVTGFVDDVRPWYGRAKITLVPALAGPGVKSTVLQAWAMQRPVVTTQPGTRGLPAEQGVNLLVGSSAAAVVDAITEALASEMVRDRLGRAGRETVLAQRRIDFVADQFGDYCMRVLNAVK